MRLCGLVLCKRILLALLLDKVSRGTGRLPWVPLPASPPFCFRSNSVSFDGVNFRASKSFRTGIRGDLERRRCIGFRTSKEWNREQLEQIVLQHIRKHGFITRATYTELTGRLKNSALADLKSFAAEGIIKRVGRGNQMHFIVPLVDDL